MKLRSMLKSSYFQGLENSVRNFQRTLNDSKTSSLYLEKEKLKKYIYMKKAKWNEIFKILSSLFWRKEVYVKSSKIERYMYQKGIKITKSQNWIETIS